MGKMIRLKAKDGHELDAYVAEPKGKPKGGIVVVQEIFGVTDHIKRVADQYAARRVQSRSRPPCSIASSATSTLDYSEIEKGREYMRKLKWPDTLADVEAAASEVREAGSVVRRRLLLGRHRRARRGERARRSTRPSRTTAAASPRCSTRSRAARSCITSAIRTRRFRCPTSRKSKRQTPRARSTSTRAQATASIATSARAYSAEDAQVAFERSLDFLREQTP